MERIVHIARSFEEADQWDREQSRSLTPRERQEIARVLRKRAFGDECPDVRESGAVHIEIRSR